MQFFTQSRDGYLVGLKGVVAYAKDGKGWLPLVDARLPPRKVGLVSLQIAIDLGKLCLNVGGRLPYFLLGHDGKFSGLAEYLPL